MRRLIIGGVALVTGAMAALGVGLGLRRRLGRHNDVLPLEPAPPLSAGSAPALANDVPAAPAPKRRTTTRSKPKPIAAPVAAAPDGPDGSVAPKAATTPKRRSRPRRKPAAAGSTSEAAPSSTEEAAAADPS